MFGNLGDMMKLMGRAKEIQEQMKKFREELPTLEFSATGMAGRIKVTVTGDFAVKEVFVAPEAAAEADLGAELQRALNTALFSAKQNVQQRMNEITGGIGIDMPGLV